MGNAKIRILEVFVLSAVKHSRDESDRKGPGVQEIFLSQVPSETAHFGGGTATVEAGPASFKGFGKELPTSLNKMLNPGTLRASAENKLQLFSNYKNYINYKNYKLCTPPHFCCCK